jgi:hypothetical protein
VIHSELAKIAAIVLVLQARQRIVNADSDCFVEEFGTEEVTIERQCPLSGKSTFQDCHDPYIQFNTYKTLHTDIAKMLESIKTDNTSKSDGALEVPEDKWL